MKQLVSPRAQFNQIDHSRQTNVAFETARVGRGFTFGPQDKNNAELRNTFHTVGNTPKLEMKVNFDLASSKGGGFE